MQLQLHVASTSRSDSVLTSMKLLHLFFIVLLYLCTIVLSKANVTVWVTRRFTYDVYFLNSYVEHARCDSGTRGSAYLINERQCVSDEELFSGMELLIQIDVHVSIYHCTECSSAITPTGASTFLIPMATIYSQHSAINTFTNDFDEYVALFDFNETNQRVNSSFCNISSLEVYRGRKRAIEINHQGFSLNDSGSVEVR